MQTAPLTVPLSHPQLADGTYVIRPIIPTDNPAVAVLLRTVLEEYGCIGEGYAHGDPEVDCMFETYQAPGAGYWVLIETATQRIVGAAGFSRLRGTTQADAVAELQKVYFYPECRGQGLGKALLEFVMAQAQQAGYQTLYLETVHWMKEAIGAYGRLGFEPIPTHRGNTGHQHKMSVFMQRPLR